MTRIKSIDTFRGFIMALMVMQHALDWWLHPSSQWFFQAAYLFIDRTFGPGFLFISGISTALYVRNRFSKIDQTPELNKNVIRHEYFIRAIIILGVSLTYNSFVALMFMDLLNIWKWFVLLTLSISLMISWPIIRKSKIFRICVSIGMWILNYFLFSFLSAYQNQTNINGLLFYIFYNSTDLEPILACFSFFLIGTVMGDYLVEKNKIIKLKNKKTFPLLISGLSMITIGAIFNYPNTFSIISLSWIIFTLGVNITTLAIIIFFEEFVKFQRKKKYWFLYYFSYYSLTIYLSHNVIYYFFLKMLNITSFFLVFIPLLIGFGLVFRIIHNTKLKRDLSIKFQIGKLSSFLAKWINNKRYIKV